MAGPASLVNAVAGYLQRRTLLPDLLTDRFGGDGRPLDDLTVVITGASGGIGRETAMALSAAGSRVIAVARRESELQELSLTAHCEYRVCDLTDEAAVELLLDDLRGEQVDVLVNNAGRSIRRSIVDSTERLHDYQRTMALNYFAAVQLSLGLLPGMIERDRGQLVNVCTWGLLAGTFPRFSAYAASKNALAIFGRSLNAEQPAPGVCATNVYFPLVSTEMITPTAEYSNKPALTAAEAADWIRYAVVHQPSDVAPAALRAVLPVLDYLAPRAADRAIAGLT